LGTPFHHLTVFPHRDRFVLQADCLDDVDWNNLGFDTGLGGSLLGFDGIHHIGIEFDPKWWDQEMGDWDSSVIDTLNDAAYGASGTVFGIWFIDHTLRRRKDAPAFKEITNDAYELNAFYTSDRKLLEVNTSSSPALEHWTYFEKEEGDADYPHGKSSIDFVNRFCEDIDMDRDPEHVTKFGDACVI
jgi:hypothetical protein